jgi:hypothetical protein
MTSVFLPSLPRRRWLQAAAATGVLAPGLHLQAGEATDRPPVQAVFDRRLPGGSAFAANAGALGLPSRGFEGDITQLWFGDLATALAAPTGPWLIGHTALEPLVCLEQMAADLRYATVVRIEHRPLPGGTEHHLTAPPAALAALRGWLEGAADWRQSLATALTAAAGTGVPGRLVHARVTTTGQLDRTAAVSWLLGPPRRV